MARTQRTVGARKSLILLVAIIAVMIGAIGLSTAKFGQSWSPKLALDLSGGTQMILSPQVSGSDGESISSDQLDQAVEIIRQRVDGAGVSEAEVTTQSGSNVVVSLPGIPDQETRDLIQASAQMSFRSVLEEGQGTPVPAESRPDYAQLDQNPPEPVSGSDPNWITPALQEQYDALDCSAGTEDAAEADPDAAAVACSADGTMKYLLGPVELTGSDISDASYSQVRSGNGTTTTGQWGVNIKFNGDATEKFRQVTERLYGIYGLNQNDPKAAFAIMLDDEVLSAPRAEAVIANGEPQITGNFTEEQARTLSEQLKYGALPISFTIQSEQQISATLGTDQLEMGIIAGLIGLFLVCLYSLFQYRTLGLVTIASLIIASVISLAAIVLLGWGVNYRLSLAGVAGLIISIGQTADSFIVYFERIRDGLRDGRSVPSAVDHGWLRARRTILASKAVNLLAAVVLYFVAVGNVRGFAFTLGLTAIADLIVIFWFTHPLMVLLSRTKYFGEGRRHSGLDAASLGAVPLYRGAGRLRDPEDSPWMRRAAAEEGGTPSPPRTIAERRRAEALARAGRDPGGTGERAAGDAVGNTAGDADADGPAPRPAQDPSTGGSSSQSSEGARNV